MKILWIAAAIESFYYNGRVLANDRKLNRDDFVVYSLMGAGSAIRGAYYDELKAGNNPLELLSGCVNTEYFEIERRGRYNLIQFDPDFPALRLPGGDGIISLAPSMKDWSAEEKEPDCGELDDFGYEDAYKRGIPGMENTLGAPEMMDDLGEPFYVPIGTTCRLFGNEKAKYVEVDYIKADENLDLPESVAWQTLNEVLGPMLKIINQPVDMTDDNNPNVREIKSGITKAQLQQ
jgi:hypothetical protein